MKIVIKVGSQAILDEQGQPNLARLAAVIEQIIQLRELNHQVILVSSGAVALGRSYAKQVSQRDYANSVADKQLLASIGQPQLMALYAQLASKHGYLTSQILLSKYDFKTKHSYGNILRVLQKACDQPKLIPIINENDSVAIEELMFTDNDELAGIIAAQTGADKLLLLTNIAGVYDRNPQLPDAQLIPEFSIYDKLPAASGKSALGRGGMSSKLNSARKLAYCGVMTHIASLLEPNIITRLIIDNAPLGTRFIPEAKKASRKKFLAVAAIEPQAIIQVNHQLTIQLTAPAAAISILPLGIEHWHGNFSRGDLLEIIAPDQRRLGVGIARYNWQKLAEYLGKPHMPALIHYDYLYIEPPQNN
jgi:glutamate 5-kinase